MKKLTLSTLSLALLGLAGAAHAQSSVTLYGVADDSITYVSNSGGKHKYELLGSQLNGNRWGVKGTEDLGGGLSAIFKLESGYNINTGKASGQPPASTLFTRQAFVGLSSNNYGTLTFGRQYDALTDLVQPLTGDQWGSMFSTPGDVDNNDNGTNVNNAVKYVSPTFSGLQFEGEYAFGGVAGSTGSGQSWSGAVSYANGPLSAAAGYLRMNNASTSAAQGWTGTTSPALGNGMFSNVVDFSTYRSVGIAQAAVQYAIGPVTGSVYYSNAQYKPNSWSGAGSSNFNTGSALLQYQATPALLLGLDYVYTHASIGGAGSGGINQIGAGAQYSLSKLTTVYGIGTYQHGAKGILASVGDEGELSDKRSQGIVSIGLDHKF